VVWCGMVWCGVAWGSSGRVVFVLWCVVWCVMVPINT
jgi:hypothetical protein